jgi:hypothetical protein
MAQSLIDGVTNYWCRTIGIRSEDLTTHPQIDDVVLLVKFIQEYHSEFSNKQRMSVYIIWDSCYYKRKPLGKKYLKALQQLGEKLNHIRNLKAQHKQTLRQKIKSLRTIPE